MKKLPYQEGTWFAVPLGHSGYAAGCVARMTPKRGGTLLGYFFGPKLDRIPTLKDVSALQPESAIWIERFGDLGLYKGTWSTIGKLQNWRREDWPIPDFYRSEPLGGKKYKIIYDENDPSKVIKEIKLSESAELGFVDGLAGAGFVEERLSRLLENVSSPVTPRA